MSIFRRAYDRILAFLLARIPTGRLKRILVQSAQQRANALEAKEGLRFLFDVEAQIYPTEGELAIKYGNGIHTKHRHTGYHDFFANRISQTDTVLDLGCGNGMLSHDVAKKTKAHVVAVDNNPSNIKIAKQRFAHPHIEYRYGDITQLAWKTPFDVVILSNILEHVRDRKNFLKKLISETQSKRILIRVPLFERDWRVPLKSELGVEWRLDSTHETEYTLDSFREEMDEAGLATVHQEARWGEIWAEVKPL